MDGQQYRAVTPALRAVELSHGMVITGTRCCCQECSQRLVSQCSKVTATGLGERNSFGQRLLLSLECRIIILSSVSGPKSICNT